MVVIVPKQVCSG